MLRVVLGKSAAVVATLGLILAVASCGGSTPVSIKEAETAAQKWGDSHVSLETGPHLLCEHHGCVVRAKVTSCANPKAGTISFGGNEHSTAVQCVVTFSSNREPAANDNWALEVSRSSDHLDVRDDGPMVCGDC